MQSSLVSFYAFVGAWGVGLVSLPLLRPVRLDAQPQMRSLISAFKDSGNASADTPSVAFISSDHEVLPALSEPSTDQSR